MKLSLDQARDHVEEGGDAEFVELARDEITEN